LEDAAAGNGFLNQYVDWDNVVRRVPLVLKLGDKAYPSLAAEALRLSLGAGSYIGRAAGANNETSFGETTGLTAIRIGQLTVPTDAAGRVSFTLPQRGVWLIKSVQMIPAPAASGAEWESLWASVTFER